MLGRVIVSPPIHPLVNSDHRGKGSRGSANSRIDRGLINMVIDEESGRSKGNICNGRGAKCYLVACVCKSQGFLFEHQIFRDDLSFCASRMLRSWVWCQTEHFIEREWRKRSSKRSRKKKTARRWSPALTCLSVRSKEAAISIRRGLEGDQDQRGIRIRNIRNKIKMMCSSMGRRVTCRGTCWSGTPSQALTVECWCRRCVVCVACPPPRPLGSLRLTLYLEFKKFIILRLFYFLFCGDDNEGCPINLHDAEGCRFRSLGQPVMSPPGQNMGQTKEEILQI